MQLQVAVSLWLGDHKPKTAESYGFVLRQFVRYIGQARPLQDITTVDCVKYAQHYAERPSVKSDATLNTHQKTLRTFFNWCIKMGFLTANPAHAIRRRKISTSVPRDKAMPEAVLNRLLQYCEWETRANALVLFLADTGCRIGGCVDLKIDDIIMEERKAYVTEKGKLEPRPVFFGETCAKALTLWLLKRKHHKGRYIFSLNGEKLNNPTLSQFFRRSCERAGIGSYGPHSLRHRKGHQLADGRVAPSLAAQLLGHEDVTITLNFYYPKDWDRVQQVARELSTDYSKDTAIIDFASRKKQA